MKSLWSDSDAAQYSGDDLALRVYSSRLLGSNEDLVLHGGGNTSVKGYTEDIFGNTLEVLYVKGSGWDLKTIEQAGFPALRLKETRQLAALDSLSDTQMTQQLRALMLDHTAPSPSVEAILHAILPYKFVDHTHTDAVVTLTNNPQGEDIVRELFSDCLILPYVMPGFILSKQVNDALKTIELSDYRGIILMHHGVFTFSDSAKDAYETMIELVSRAEQYIAKNGENKHATASKPINLLDLARIRNAVSQVRGKAQLAVLDDSPDAQGYASREDVREIGCRGPITPDHVIRTKRVPMIVPMQPAEGIPEVSDYVDDYTAYFDRNTTGDLTRLDAAPRMAVWQQAGTIAFGSTLKECRIIGDIARHTRWAIQTGESLGGWEALPEADIFELEYWVLEQAKLGKKGVTENAHAGKIAIVTGANSGIGKATAEALTAEGATVVGIDRAPEIAQTMDDLGMAGIQCDLTDADALQASIEAAVALYGGVDIVICNAGIFTAGEPIERQSKDTWDQTLAINLTATQQLITCCIPYLKLGIDPSIILVGSRNVNAPGPGAAAYSVSKAGITQLARVAALELAGDGIRVNTVHPDAVFDTALWTEEALKTSAERYQLTIEEYKSKNLLKTEILAADVGALISTLAGPMFRKTTGAQIPVDGGNDRVI